MDSCKLFSYCYEDLIKSPVSWGESKQKLSKFDKALTETWDTAMKNGLFRYTLKECMYKKLDLGNGKRSLPAIAQLNLQRAVNRRKRESFPTMNDEFNEKQFNFTKVKKEEILLEIVKTSSRSSNSEFLENGEVINPPKHKILINISPIEYGHVLIAPNLEKCLPQRLTIDALLLAFDLVQLSSHPGFRVSFNSLHAWASINHLHFHGMYCDHELFADVLPPERHIKGSCYMLDDSSPLPAFVLDLPENEDGRIKIAEDVLAISKYLHQVCVPYNLSINRGRVQKEDGDPDEHWSTRVLLWPRKSSKNLDPAPTFDVACIEVSGHFPIKTKECFEEMMPVQAREILSEAALDAASLEEIISNVKLVL